MSFVAALECPADNLVKETGSHGAVISLFASRRAGGGGFQGVFYAARARDVR